MPSQEWGHAHSLVCVQSGGFLAKVSNAVGLLEVAAAILRNFRRFLMVILGLSNLQVF